MGHDTAPEVVFSCVDVSRGHYFCKIVVGPVDMFAFLAYLAVRFGLGVREMHWKP